MKPKVSLHHGDGNDGLTSGTEEAEASGQITGDEEGPIQSNKDSKRKSPPPTSIQSYTHTKRPKKLVSSEKSNKQRTTVLDHEKKQKAARPDTDDSTGSEKGDSDEDYENRKRSATAPPTLTANIQQNILGDGTQSPAELPAMLIETERQLERAEWQVRAISKTRVADTFLEGQVRTWTKETLWKMCNFITSDQTMHKVMHKASKHFKVPASEQEHWKASYAHIVRDELNQKRNACLQDLRKTIKSKCPGIG
jgi:C4-dicarboxylate-specific signal transduction histidine kinase